MSLPTKSVTIIRQEWNRTGNGFNQIEETITYPNGCSLHFEANQQCLTIRDKGGQVLAAFVGLKRFKSDVVTTTDPIVTPPAPSVAAA